MCDVCAVCVGGGRGGRGVGRQWHTIHKVRSEASLESRLSLSLSLKLGFKGSRL